LATNPFVDIHDNPFDDGHAINNDSSSQSSPSSMYAMEDIRSYQPPIHQRQQSRHNQQTGKSSQRQFKQHRPSHSQSSYFNHRFRQTHNHHNSTSDMFIPMKDTASTKSGDHKYSNDIHANDTRGHHRSQSTESMAPLPMDQRSIVSQTSISNSCLSFDPETLLESRNHMEDEEGRSMAIHGRVDLKIPERSAAAMTATAYRQRQVPNINKNDIDGSATNSRRQQKQQQQQQQQQRRSVSRTSSTQHQHTTSDISQDNAPTFVELIQMETRSYLSHADLDSTTRAQVKEHLAIVLGERTRMDYLQDTINNFIEEITLELLSQQSVSP
jgi:hypothetical protein